MRKFTPEKENFYHIVNRGTEKRRIFLNHKDYERFIANMVAFNTENDPRLNISRYNLNKIFQHIPTNRLVKIHAFCLLPNHFHLLLEQLAENGISRFMHRLEMGYARYFNILHNRNGNLFQGAYKLVPMEDEAHQLYLPIYIHLNPLDLLPTEKHWRENGIKDHHQAMAFLKKYPWSSFTEYYGTGNLPFISKELLNDLYKNSDDWDRAIMSWSSKK
ncbi:MAG: transposase [Candidatus Niyogibacteria bacterium]|nr:transposase [Candidatus Niyogibacteria bacterium]